MISKPFYYQVLLRCEFGPDQGDKLLGKCMVVANNATVARRRIIEFVAEQNRAPVPEDVELNRDERRHINEHWSRWVVESLDVTEPFRTPADKDIYWDGWIELPQPEEP